MSILRCIGCGFLGALGALILGVFVFSLASVLRPNPGGVFGNGALLLVTAIVGIPGGFALGAIYGAIRTLTSLKKGQAAPIATPVIGAIVLLVFVVFILSVALEPTAPPRPLKIRPIAQQTIWVGKPLNILVSVEHAQKGCLRYSLGPNAPVGSVIDAETGVFTWTPTEAQGPGKHDVVVLAMRQMVGRPRRPSKST